MTTFGAQAPVMLPDLRFGFAPLPEPEPGFDPAGDARALVFAGTHSLARYPIPGNQVRGSLGPGQRFVLRLPAVWNGKLAVCGTPATRSEYANDAMLGDFLLARGYAFAASNKGIPYNAILVPAAGVLEPGREYRIPFASPGIAADEYLIRSGALAPLAIGIDRWHADFVELTRAARDYVRAHYGRAARLTYAVGLSMGGGQVRYLLERHPELVDGGLEWAAVYWHPDRHLLTYLPAFLAAMPAYAASGYIDAAAHAAIVAAGFPADRRGTTPGHASLWDDHYAKLFPHYADFTTYLFARLLDPAAPPLASRAARAGYAPSPAVRASIAPFAQTGALERPLIGLAGDADVFVTPENNAAPYLAAVRAAGCGDRFWQYIVAGGTHVDGYCSFGYGLQPQLPFVWRAFEQLEEIVEGGRLAPGAGTARAVHVPADI